MPSIKLNDIELASKRWKSIPGEGYKTQQFGDFEIGYTSLPAGVDCTSTYKEGGLAGGVCQCPHYGYVFKGKIRCVYPDTGIPDDVAEAGDAYFFPAGHVLIYEAPTDALELNPAFALQELMSGINRAMENRIATGGEIRPPGQRGEKI